MTSNAEPIVQRDFSTGITMDEYAPLRNSCAWAKGVDITPTKVTLSTHNQNNVVSIDNNSYITTIWDILASQNGYIYDIDGTMIYDISNVTNYENIRNYADFTISGTDYRVLVSKKFLHRYTPNALFTYTDLAWSGTNRSFAWLDLTHTPWSTVVFTWSAPAVSGKQYVLDFDVNTMTAWSFTITIWWATAVNITANGNYKLPFKANTTAWVIITPTTSFNGSITGLNMIWASTMTEWFAELTNLSDLAPILVDQWDMYIGNGNIVAVIDNLWVKYDALTLPKGIEIVWITRDEQYIVIWTRSDKNSTIYFRDWINDIAISSKLWKNDIIQSVEDQWDFCYVVTGNNSQTRNIWKTNWYSRALAYSIPYGNWYSWNGNNTGILPSLPLHFFKYDTKGNNITTNDTSSFWEYIFLPSKNSVIVYGRRNPSLPFGMFNKFPLINCWGVYSIYAENEEVVISYDDTVDDVCKVIRYKLNNQDTVWSLTDDYYYGSTGFFELLPIISLKSQINYAVSIELWYITPTDTFMNMFYKIDWSKNSFTFVCDTTASPITTLPDIWDVYTINSNDLELESINEYDNYTYITFKRTSWDYIVFNNDFLTRDTGSWDINIEFIRRYDYKFLWTIDSTLELDINKRVRKISEQYSEIKFAIELNTNDPKQTPAIYDNILYHDIKPNG